MKPRPDLTVETAEGEIIVLDKDGGKVHQMNETAALIWNCLDEGLGTEEIVARLANAFEVERDTAFMDVQNIVAQFSELGLLDYEK